MEKLISLGWGEDKVKAYLKPVQIEVGALKALYSQDEVIKVERFLRERGVAKK